MRYASDDTDDLLGSIITNSHKSKEKEKPKGAVDQLVEDAYQKAMSDYKKDEKKETVDKNWRPLGQQEQWAKLMKEPDPLEECDIYATEKKDEDDAPKLVQVDSEQTEMEDDINDLLNQSFKKEKKKSSFVKNVPYLLQMKKSENYDKLFQGVSVQDIASMEE